MIRNILKFNKIGCLQIVSFSVKKYQKFTITILFKKYLFKFNIMTKFVKISKITNYKSVYT